MGLPCSADMKIAFLKISEKDVEARPEWAAMCEVYSRNFVRDVLSYYGVGKMEGGLSEPVIWKVDSSDKFVWGRLEMHFDERSLRLQRHIIRDLWDNRERNDALTLEYTSPYADQEAGEAIAATERVLQQMADEMNCVIGFDTYDYERLLDWQSYYRPKMKPVKMEELGFALRSSDAVDKEEKSSFDLGFDWHLKLLTDQIAKDEFLREEAGEAPDCKQQLKGEDGFPF